jgi:hypothetical protein
MPISKIRRKRGTSNHSRVGRLPYALRLLAAHAKTGQVALALTRGTEVSIRGATPGLLSIRTYKGLRGAVDAATAGSSNRLFGSAPPAGLTLVDRGTLDTDRFTAVAGAPTVNGFNRVYGVVFHFFAAFNDFDYGPFTISHGLITNTAGTLSMSVPNTIYRLTFTPKILPFRISCLSAANAGSSFNVATGDFGNPVDAAATSQFAGWKIETCANAKLLVIPRSLNQKDLSPMQNCGSQAQQAVHDELDEEENDISDLLDDEYYPGID